MTIPVNLGAQSYAVDVDTQGWDSFAVGLAERVGTAGVFVVSDDEVSRIWKETFCLALTEQGISPVWIDFPNGERNKTTTTWLEIVHRLSAAGIQRDSWVVAFGGGVVGDLAGFAAASILRGVRWVQVPTTLLAMVDASVGGKTAVNLPLGKNLLGAFHQPSWVYASIGALQTLPQRELRSGLGEVLKMAALEGGAYWSWLTQSAAALVTGHPSVVIEAIVRSVTMKSSIVSEDERDANRRLLLNAGHTLGHAIETALGHGTLTHGEAVAVGLLHECRFAVASGVCLEPEMPDRIASVMRAFEIPMRLQGLDLDRVKSAIFLDKKAVGNKIKVPLPVSPGQYRIEWMGEQDIDSLIRTLSL